MPFKSMKQERFMFSQHPKIAKKWAKEMKKNHQSMTSNSLPTYKNSKHKSGDEVCEMMPCDMHAQKRKMMAEEYKNNAT